MTAARSLSRSTTDRDAARRTDPRLLEELAEDPETRLVLVDARGRVALDAPAAAPDLPQDGLTPASAESGWGRSSTASTTARGAGSSAGTGSDGGPRLAPLSAAELSLTGLTTFYLGRDEGTSTGDAAGRSWLGVVVPGEDDLEAQAPTDAEGAGLARPDLGAVLARYPMSALRAVGAVLSDHDAGLATPGVALAAWHSRSGYCPGCGGRTEPVQAGWARRCTVCGALGFPRTDPAVIMAVTDDADRIVLVHGAAWAERRFSTVAGFIEAGESAESAVVREVAEETGLRVAEVELVATQPWPFPRSLMLGFRARLAAGERLARPDGEEVTDVVVLSRTELASAVSSGAVVLPGETSIARALIEGWYGGPILA